MWKFQKWGAIVKVFATCVALIYFVNVANSSKTEQKNQVASAPNTATDSSLSTEETKQETTTQVETKSERKEASKPKQIAQPETELDTNVVESAQAQPERGNVSIQDIEGVGKREVGIVDDVQYCVLKVEKAQTLGNEFASKKADGIFIVLRVAAHNTDKETHDVNASLMRVIDDQGREFDPSIDGTEALGMSKETHAASGGALV